MDRRIIFFLILTLFLITPSFGLTESEQRIKINEH